MNFGKAFKVFQLQILKSSGMAVTPQQFGLKSDPVADLQAKTTTSSFSKVLGGLNPPAPPTPPSDPADSAAQAKYQQELLVYNNNFQLYNQRVMQLMLNQFQAMQQSLATVQKNASDSGAKSDDSAGSVSAIGSILG